MLFSVRVVAKKMGSSESKTSESKQGKNCGKMVEETEEIGMKMIMLDKSEIPEEELKKMRIRFSSLDPQNRFFITKRRIYYKEVIELADKRHIRLMAFNAPCLMLSGGPAQFGYEKVTPGTFAQKVDNGMNILHALAIMANDAFFLQKKIEEQSARSVAEEVEMAANACDELINSVRYNPIVATMRNFVSSSGTSVTEDLVKSVIKSYIARSRDALFHSKCAKGCGWGAVATSAAAVGTATGVTVGVVSAFGVSIATIAAPIAIPLLVLVGPVVALSVLSVKSSKTSDQIARSTIELMKAANYCSMFSQLTDMLSNRTNQFEKSNVCMMAFDDLQDIENAPTRPLIRSLADVLKDPKYQNKGTLVDFIRVSEKGSDEYAPAFSEKNREGFDLFSFYAEIFYEMKHSPTIQKMSLIKGILEGSPSQKNCFC